MARITVDTLNPDSVKQMLIKMWAETETAKMQAMLQEMLAAMGGSGEAPTDGLEDSPDAEVDENGDPIEEDPNANPFGGGGEEPTEADEEAEPELDENGDPIEPEEEVPDGDEEPEDPDAEVPDEEDEEDPDAPPLSEKDKLKAEIKKKRPKFKIRGDESIAHLTGVVEQIRKMDRT